MSIFFLGVSPVTLPSPRGASSSRGVSEPVPRLLDSDELILRAIYSEGNGPFWSDSGARLTWLNESIAPCQWKGVTCLVENGTGVGRVGKLEFIGFGVTALSDKVGGLDRLFYLDMDGNRLTTVPESIGRLGELRNLYLLNNQLQSIPETIGQLMNLQRLYILLFNHRICTFWLTLSFHRWLNNNQLQSIPGTIGQLANLQWLYISLSNHRICTFGSPCFSFFSQAPLQQPAPVHPRDHRSAHEPPTAVHFAIQSSHLHLLAHPFFLSLFHRDLSYNQLQSIPETTGQLTSLQELYILLFNHRICTF